MGWPAELSDKVYSNRGNPLVLEQVPTNITRVLDLGCGAGDNARQLHARGIQVDAVTLSNKEAALAVRFCRNVFVHDLERGLPAAVTDSYPICICSHVLEHLRTPQRLLEQIRPLLAPQTGKLIIALPNLLMWRYRLRLMFGRFEYEPTGVMDATHVRWFTYRSARELFRQTGYVVLRETGEGSFPLAALRRILPRSVPIMIDDAAVRLFPELFALQMVFTLGVAQDSEGSNRSDSLPPES